MPMLRIRVLSSGTGLQPQSVQEFVNTDAPGPYLPSDPVELYAHLLHDAAELYLQAMKDAREAELEHANEHGSIPPGMGYGPPSAIMVLVEEIPANPTGA